MSDDRFRDVLVFLNEKNLLKSSISLTSDRIKSEFTSLRRHTKSIRIGICRCSDRSLFNNATIRHLSSLTFDEFQKLSLDEFSTPSFNESRKSLINIDEPPPNTDSKKILYKNKTLIQKRSTSPNRDSGFIEADGTNTSMVTDRSVISNYNKRRSKSSMEKSEDESIDTHKSLDSLHPSISKTITEQIKTKPSSLIYSTQTHDKHRRIQRDLPTQTVTDACFIYRRQVIKQDTTDNEKTASILRGREIAHEAANTPTIPSSMPNYTRDQIRELYGELDKTTRRLQEDEYILHSPIKNSSTEKPQWKLASPTKSKIIDECPLPKFRLDQTSDNDETLLMAAYLSTGLNNSRTKPVAPVDNFHTVMMNASAKVNEWANNNELYLTTIEKDVIQTDRSTINSSPLLLDVHLNLKKLTGTPTGNNDRPTYLAGIEQQTTNNSNENINNRENRRSFRRQQHTTDTNSSSPDSIDIVLEVTPSTPGSCGMYLEPYMRHGYDLPSIDHQIRDSSWQHDIQESVTSTKNITPIESPTTPKFDTNNILPSSPIISQIIDTDSLMDLDDGATNSYHTAKESRLDNTHQSTLSFVSDETTSTLHQPTAQDDRISNIFSPDGSFYYDALASPSQTNQQIISSIDKQNLLIDNLTNLLEEIETFNRTNYFNDEKSRLPPEGEESTNNIDQLFAIVQDIHQLHQSKSTNATDNLLFIYDNDINDEQPTPLIDNLVDIVHAINQTPSCVNNLLFIYDDIITPTDGEEKQIANDSDEWSYDNLTTDQKEQINTDHLGTIVYEALTTRFQKSIKFKQTKEVEEEDSAVKFQKPINEINDENLEPIKMKTTDQLEPEVPKEESQQPADEPIVDTDNLGTIAHETIAASSQEPIVEFNQELPTEKFEKHITEFNQELPTEKFEEYIAEVNQELPTEKFEEHIAEFNQELPTKKFEEYIAEVNQALPAEKFEQHIDEFNQELPTEKFEEYIAEVNQELPTEKLEEHIAELNQELPTEKFEEYTAELTVDSAKHETPKELTNEFHQEFVPFNFGKPTDESIDDTHTLETLIYEIESLNRQRNFPVSESNPPPVSNLSQIVSDSLLTSSNYYRHNQDENKIEFNIIHQPPIYDEEIYEEYGYRRTTTDPETDDVVEKFEELCRRYSSSFDEYEKTTKKFDDDIDQFEKQLHEQKQQISTPTSDITTSEELITTIERVPDKTIRKTKIDDSHLTLTVKRQPNYIGKYGFDFEEFFDGKIKISSIIDENYCPNLNIGDEILSINNNRTFKTREQCQLILDSLWKNFYEDIQITVIKSANIPHIPTSEPVSLQSSSLSWPLSIVEPVVGALAFALLL